MLAFALLAAGCDKDDIEDEVGDVVEEHNEAARQAIETPGDTAAINEELRERDEEHAEAVEATRKAVQQLQDTTVH